MKIRYKLATIISLASLALGAGASSAATLLSETFPAPPANVSQDQHLRDIGWCGGNAGDQFCNNAVGQNGNDNQGGEGAVSVGNGQDGAPGFAFWSQTGINADGFLYTDDFLPFLSSDFLSLSWYQRDSERSQLTRLGFRIGTDWYVSKTGYLSASSTAWTQFSVTDLALLSFVKYDGGGNGAILPGGDASGGIGAALPNGVINAFGFVWDGSKSGTSRIDTVVLEAIPVPPAAAALALGIGCLSGFSAFARRRRQKLA